MFMNIFFGPAFFMPLGIRHTGKTGSFLSMAPEVMLARPYNEKADIFSLACCITEVSAAGRPSWGSL